MFAISMENSEQFQGKVMSDVEHCQAEKENATVLKDRNKVKMNVMRITEGQWNHTNVIGREKRREENQSDTLIELQTQTIGFITEIFGIG